YMNLGNILGALEVIKGPNHLMGQRLPLNKDVVVLGRDQSADISLPSAAVSRRHARLSWQDGTYFVEDLGSTNGIKVNDRQVTSRTPVTESDELRIGDLVLRFTGDAEHEHIVQGKVNVRTINQELLSLNPARKLQMVLELSRHLSRTWDQPALLEKLLE